MKALKDNFQSTLLEDVIKRHDIRNTNVLESLINYLMINIGKTFSALSIANYFKSQQIKVSVDTILSYLKIIGDSYLIHKTPRFDVLGKAALKVEEKYYLADQGFREMITANNVLVIETILENIVYLELLRRGYSVFVGKINNKEVDFVATKPHQTIYFQVAYKLETLATVEREFGNLKQINDNFPKYVVTMESVDYTHDGVKQINIEEFLLTTKWE
jgi:predicted AAA+ superfamily ATPase